MPPKIELERRGVLLFVKCGEDQRVVSFEADKPSNTGKELKKALEGMGITDQKTISYALSWLADTYDTEEIILQGEMRIVPKPAIITDGFIAEEVWDRKNPPQYCVYNFKTQDFKYETKIELGEEDAKGRKIIYQPVDNDSLRKGLVIVPRKPKECTLKEVIDKAFAFTKKHYDASGKDIFVQLLECISISSWFLDRYSPASKDLIIAGMGKYAPILPIRGPSRSGKNRLANALRLLSYRAYLEMATDKIPSVYRPLDLWRGTLVLDEADVTHTSERSEFTHFLNCRATGTPISRQDPTNPVVTHTFDTFGLSILTQRRIFDDNATEDRAIPYYSEKTDREDIPVVELDEMIEEGLELQDMLLYLRMKYYNDIIVDKKVRVENVSDTRLIAAVLPLLALSKIEPEIQDIVTKTLKEIEKIKIKIKSMSDDGVVVNLIWEKIEEELYSQYHNLYYVLDERIQERDQDGKPKGDPREIVLTTSIIAERLKWSSKFVKKVINSLNLADEAPITIRIGKKTIRPIFFKPSKLAKIIKEFILDYDKTKLPKEPKNVTDVTDVTDSIYGTQKITDSKPPPEKALKNGIPYIESVTPVTSVTYYCNACPAKFASAADLKSHYEANHSTEGDIKN